METLTRRGSLQVAAAGGALALAAVTLTAPGAAQGDPASNPLEALASTGTLECAPTPPLGATGQLFTYSAADPGSPQYFTVPTGVTSLAVYAVGGTGGTGAHIGPPGWGAYVTALVPVQPGACLSAYPGGYGSGHGGIGFLNGGDHGTTPATDTGFDGGTGGAMTVLYGGINSTVMAGGGGGGGGNGGKGPGYGQGGAGGGSGANGAAGQPGTSDGSAGGGAGGCGGCVNDQTGGNGEDSTFSGAGGGGGSGWSGGAGGGQNGDLWNLGGSGGGGGGAGSSWVSAAATSVVYQTASASNCQPKETAPACNGWVYLQWGGSGADTEPPAAKPPATGALIGSSTVTTGARGRVGVKVTCASQAKCSGRLVLHTSPPNRTWHRAAARKYTVPGGESKIVRVGMNPDAPPLRKALATVSTKSRGQDSDQIHRRLVTARAATLSDGVN